MVCDYAARQNQEEAQTLQLGAGSWERAVAVQPGVRAVGNTSLGRSLTRRVEKSLYGR